jgi:hypothetical protein
MAGIPECDIVGYRADFVAIVGLNNEHHTRYAKHSGLEKMYMISRPDGNGNWRREIYGDIDRWFVCVFEVKVSRADFLNTFGNKNSPHAKARIEPVGTAHWVVADKGVCKPEELPDFWGLLEPYGTGLTERKMPKLNNLPDERLHAFGFDMLWQSGNFRRSQWYQLTQIAKAADELHRAIVCDASKERLLSLSKITRETCNGLCE